MFAWGTRGQVNETLRINDQDSQIRSGNKKFIRYSFLRGIAPSTSAKNSMLRQVVK